MKPHDLIIKSPSGEGMHDYLRKMEVINGDTEQNVEFMHYQDEHDDDISVCVWHMKDENNILQVNFELEKHEAELLRDWLTVQIEKMK